MCILLIYYHLSQNAYNNIIADTSVQPLMSVGHGKGFVAVKYSITQMIRVSALAIQLDKQCYMVLSFCSYQFLARYSLGVCITILFLHLGSFIQLIHHF